MRINSRLYYTATAEINKDKIPIFDEKILAVSEDFSFIICKI